MINYRKSEKLNEFNLTNIIQRCPEVMDEINNVSLEIERFKLILTDILIFDFLTSQEYEIRTRRISSRLNIRYTFLMYNIEKWIEEILSENLSSKEVEELDTMNSKTKNLLRLDKKRILFKIKEDYPDFYSVLEKRAYDNIVIILGGLI